MIGKAYKAMSPYYDRITNQQKFKSRPCLVIGRADAGDYVVLPISTIPDKTKVDSYYDIPLDKATFSFLNRDSYLRTHKQTVINVASLKDQLSDFRSSYEETYIEALSKVEDFQKKLIENAM